MIVNECHSTLFYIEICFGSSGGSSSSGNAFNAAKPGLKKTGENLVTSKPSPAPFADSVLGHVYNDFMTTVVQPSFDRTSRNPRNWT
jgi:hypothetical protein